MLDEIKKLSSELIKIASVKEDPQSLHKVLDVAKKQLTGFTIEEFEKNGTPSLLIYAGKKRPEHFKVILNAHLDVVPAKSEQYQVIEKEGNLYGRGTYDMKAGGAVEIIVFKELAKKLDYPIALQLVTDEEIGGYNGVKYQIEKGVIADFVIAGEGTNLQIKNKAKGIIWARLKTIGKTAHGAYVWNGENAIWKMEQVLQRIKKEFPLPVQDSWVTTINVATIETSNKTQNKVPDDCTVTLDIRYIPEDKDRICTFLTSLEKDGVAIEYMARDSAQFTSENNTYIQKLQTAVYKVIGTKPDFIQKPGGSDVRHYANVGIDGIEFGPIGEGLHTDNEWVMSKSLEDYCSILNEFLLSL